jgi:hypothetical protein
LGEEDMKQRQLVQKKWKRAQVNLRMTDDIEWDYSKIPGCKWQWFFVEDHWMDLEVDESGLAYYGTDWTCQSGGRYFGGFQTFEEFFEKGPIQEMPLKVAKEVGEFLKEHRKRGNVSTLLLHYTHGFEGFVLTGVFVHIDGKPIHVKEVRETGKVLLYEGSIRPGEHKVSFVFVLRSDDSQKKTEGEVLLNVQPGVNRALLKTRDGPAGTILTTVLYQ